MPQYKVEVAFNAGYSTPAASRTWTDVSAYVEGDQPLTISRGRADELGQIDASRLRLTLDNSGGRFTPEKTSGAYYPNVKKGRPIRVTARYNAVDYVRFTGYVDEWPIAWPDAVDGRALVTITASSRQARLGKDSQLRSVVEEEVERDDPVAYWTLSEPSGSTVATDSSGGGAPRLTVSDGSGAAPSFGEATGPGTDGLTAASFAGGAPDARVLKATGIAWPASGSVEFWFTTTTAGIDLLEMGGVHDVVIFGGGQIAVSGSGFGPVVTDGKVHQCVVLYGPSGSALYVDGAFVWWASVDTPADSSLLVGGGNASGARGACTIAHVAIYPTQLSAARIADHYLAGATGFAGPSGARISRYAGYAQIPAGEVIADTGSSTISNILTAGKTPIEVMQTVAATENGVLYDGRDGSLIFKGRAARYNVASAFTLSAAAQEVEADLEPKLDDQFLVNDVTVTDSDGRAERVIDAASVAEYGAYREQIELATSSDLETLAAAQWRVALGNEPRVRYSTVGVDVVNSSTSQAAAVLAADIGTRFGLSGLPSQAPSSTADLFVEGYAETITATRHGITFNTSPTYGYAGTVGVWHLDVNSIDGPAVLAY